MTATFEVESFERLVATPGTVLLRVAGRWRAAHDETLPDPVLRVGDWMVEPLPGPAAPQAGPDAPRWAAAYAVPADLPRGAFALEVGAQLFSLPEPGERDGVPAAVPAVDVGALQQRAAEVAEMARAALREAGPLRDRVAELERRLADRAEELEELRRRCDEAEGAQAEEAAARRRAEEEVDTLARRLDEAELARDHLRAAARDAEAAAREAEAERDRLREAPALREVPAPADAKPGDGERRLVLVLFVVALVAGGALVALELTHVLQLTGSF